MTVMPEQRLDTAALAELSQRPQWVRWQYVMRGEEPTKPPFQVDGRQYASSNDPSTWATYDQVLRAHGDRPLTEGGGIGFVFAPDDELVGIDLDGCRDPETGRLAEWSHTWIRALGSYTEVSPSGTGVKVFVHGALPGPGRKERLLGLEQYSASKAPAVEAYDRGRYFTVTGLHLKGTPEGIHPNQSAIDILYATFFGDRVANDDQETDIPPSPGLSDEDLLSIARNASNADLFARLFDDGDTSDYGGDDSSADLALVNLLIFYTGDDLEQLDRLFRQSALSRPKWTDREDYRALTINKAASGLEAVYQADAGPTVKLSGAVAKPPPSSEAEEPPAWAPKRLISDQELAQAARQTWLDRYVKYCEMRTDAPSIFHEALGLVALAAVVGRSGGIKLSRGVQFPSLYVLLIAASTIYRKSTSLDLLRELLGRVNTRLLAPNEFTPQRFVAIMAEHDGESLVFARDEFGGFYDGLNRLDFQAGLKEHLCDFYDGRPFRREKMKKKKSDDDDSGEWKYDVQEPFLCIAAGTTFERFLNVAQDGDIDSGFLPRFALIVPDTEPPDGSQEITVLTREVEQKRDDLVADLVKLQQTALEFVLEPSMLRRFNRYNREVSADAKESPHPNLVRIVGGRCAWMAFHVAVLLAASGTTRKEPQATIRLAHLLRGIELAERWRHTSIRVLHGLSPSRMERHGTRLVDAVRSRGDGGMLRRDAMRMLRVSRKEMNDIEATLIDRGEVRVARTNVAGGVSVRYFAI